MREGGRGVRWLCGGMGEARGLQKEERGANGRKQRQEKSHRKNKTDTKQVKYNAIHIHTTHVPVGPTRTCPCSINVMASFNVSAIFTRTITTGSRRRQKVDAARVSHCARDFLVGIKPMS